MAGVTVPGWQAFRLGCGPSRRASHAVPRGATRRPASPARIEARLNPESAGESSHSRSFQSEFPERPSRIAASPPPDTGSRSTVPRRNRMSRPRHRTQASACRPLFQLEIVAGLQLHESPEIPESPSQVRRRLRKVSRLQRLSQPAAAASPGQGTKRKLESVSEAKRDGSCARHAEARSSRQSAGVKSAR